jgi:hypothetical protein
MKLRAGAAYIMLVAFAAAGCTAYRWHKTSVLRLAIVQAWAKPSQLLRPYVAEVARRPQYSHVVFAEIDVDQLSVGTCCDGMCSSRAWSACNGAHAAEVFK